MEANSKKTGQFLLCRVAHGSESQSVLGPGPYPVNISGLASGLNRAWNSSYSGRVRGTHSFVTMVRSAVGCASPPKAQGGLSSSYYTSPATEPQCPSLAWVLCYAGNQAVLMTGLPAETTGTVNLLRLAPVLGERLAPGSASVCH